MKRLILRIAGNGGPEFRDCRRKIRFLQIGGTKIALITGVLRTKLQGCAESGYRAIAIAGLQECEAEIVLRFGILRLKAKQLTKSHGGIGRISGALQSLPQKIEDFRLSLVNFQRSLQGSNGLGSSPRSRRVLPR